MTSPLCPFAAKLMIRGKGELYLQAPDSPGLLAKQAWRSGRRPLVKNCQNKALSESCMIEPQLRQNRFRMPCSTPSTLCLANLRLPLWYSGLPCQIWRNQATDLPRLENLWLFPPEHSSSDCRSSAKGHNYEIDLYHFSVLDWCFYKIVHVLCVQVAVPGG